MTRFEIPCPDPVGCRVVHGHQGGSKSAKQCAARTRVTGTDEKELERIDAAIVAVHEAKIEGRRPPLPITAVRELYAERRKILDRAKSR